MMDDRKQKTPDVILPGERVQAVSLDSIHPFQGHPFKVREDADMEALKESIRTSGVITPAVVRPLPEGGYEMVSGHRRLAACRVLGLEKMPVIVREMDDDTATLWSWWTRTGWALSRVWSCPIFPKRSRDTCCRP